MNIDSNELRTKTFAKVRRGGYSKPEVELFLQSLADRLEAGDTPGAPDVTAGDATSATAEHPDVDGSFMLLQHAQRQADETLDEAESRAAELLADAQARADEARRDADDQRDRAAVDARARAADLIADAQLQADQLTGTAAVTAQEEIEAARTTAARGLQRAREHTDELIRDAEDRNDRAARAEAEAELRLVHLEQQLAERSRDLTAQARRIEELARILVAPPAPSDTRLRAGVHGDETGPDSTGEVIELKRAE